MHILCCIGCLFYLSHVVFGCSLTLFLPLKSLWSEQLMLVCYYKHKIQCVLNATHKHK